MQERQLGRRERFNETNICFVKKQIPSSGRSSGMSTSYSTALRFLANCSQRRRENMFGEPGRSFT